MTTSEFQHQYHNYMTNDEMEALAEAVKVNEKMTDGHKVVPMNFGGQWCLMIDTAASAVGGMF